MDRIKAGWSAVRRFKPLRTAAQTALGLVGTNVTGITDVDWVAVSSASGLAALLVVLMALADGSTLMSEPGAEPEGLPKI